MKRNFVRYNRGGILLDVQNQKYHHNIIKNPRKSMQIRSQTYQQISYSQSGRHKQLTKLRYSQNQRLFKALRTIKLNKGSFDQMYKKAQQTIKERKSLQHLSQFRKDQRKIQLLRGNTRLVCRIQQTKPKIGSNIQWQKHFTNFQKQKQKMSRARHHFFNAQSAINQSGTINLTTMQPSQQPIPNHRYKDYKMKSSIKQHKKSRSSASDYLTAQHPQKNTSHDKQQYQQQSRIHYRRSDGEKIKTVLHQRRYNNSQNQSHHKFQLEKSNSLISTNR